MPEQTVIAYISAGSSVEPRRNLENAAVMLRETVHITGVSTVYRTPAIDRPNDPDFLNCVFQISTDVLPRALTFDVLRAVEDRLGRRRLRDKYAPRRIDLDLILYGDQTIDEPDLTIPHPDLSRWFVRVPLLELSPDVCVPGAGRLRDLWPDDDERGQGSPVPDVTDSLRRRIVE